VTVGEVVQWEEVERASIWVGARTSADGRELLLVLGGDHEYDEADPCTAMYRTTADETDAGVVVTLEQAIPPAPERGCDQMPVYRTAEVSLRDPLGDRGVQAFGEVKEVFDGSTLVDVTWLPDGYTVEWEMPGDVPGSWNRRWFTRPPYEPTPCEGDNYRVLSLTEGPLDYPIERLAFLELADTFPVGDAVGSYYVSGRPMSPEVAVTWELDGRRLIIDAYGCADGSPIDIETMARIAQSVHMPPATKLAPAASAEPRED